MGSGGTMRGGEPLTADAGRPVGLQLIDDALQNLGESVPMEYREVHAYFHMINGGARLRGLAREQVESIDPAVSAAAETAVQIAKASTSHKSPTTASRHGHRPGTSEALVDEADEVDEALVDEDGNIVGEADEAAAGCSSSTAASGAQASALNGGDKLSAEVNDVLAAEVTDLKEELVEVKKVMMDAFEEMHKQQEAMSRQLLTLHRQQGALLEHHLRAAAQKTSADDASEANIEVGDANSGSGTSIIGRRRRNYHLRKRHGQAPGTEPAAQAQRAQAQPVHTHPLQTHPPQTHPPQTHPPQTHPPPVQFPLSSQTLPPLATGVDGAMAYQGSQEVANATPPAAAPTATDLTA